MYTNTIFKVPLKLYSASMVQRPKGAKGQAPIERFTSKHAVYAVQLVL